MKPGDKVYVAVVGSDREGAYEYTLEAIGVDRAILRIVNDHSYYKAPDRFTSYPLNHVFATKKEAEEFIGRNQKPQVGDYVAVINYDSLMHGLVLKVHPKMVDILLSDPEDIKQNKGKMKARYHHYQVVSLLRNQHQ